MNKPFRHRRAPRPCTSCGEPYTTRGKFFCSRECAGNTKHGYSFTSVHNAWCDMRKRCTDPGHHAWDRYGGRGIRVCERWDVFENFLADMGEKPGKEYSLDRIDNDKDYEPGNCKWATRLEQTRNRSISWKKDEDDRLAELLKRGLRHVDIAPLLGKSKESVSARASRLKLRSRRCSGGRLRPLELLHDGRQRG